MAKIKRKWHWGRTNVTYYNEMIEKMAKYAVAAG